MNEHVEAVLLTGGASRRMGQDKAKLRIEGEPLAQRIARLLGEMDVPVTTCGREPIEGAAFVPDAEEFAGPLAALAGFEPKRDLVFLCSCDLPGFDARIVTRLTELIGSHEAAVPEADGRLQPLCGLYRSTALGRLRELHAQGERRVMKWLEQLDYAIAGKLPSEWIRNVNYPSDL